MTDTHPFTLLELPTFRDARGALTVLEGALPFEVRRTYWIYASDGELRGGHRHHRTRQALIAVHGSVVMHMNDGSASRDIVLESPQQCLLVEPKDWHTMRFGPGAVLLVMASEPYDRADYIDTPYE